MERTIAQLQRLKRAIMSAGIPDDDDDREDAAPAGYGPNTSMPMPVVVVALNGAARLVPPGWRNLLTETHHKVRGAIAQSVRRRNVTVGPKSHHHGPGVGVRLQHGSGSCVERHSPKGDCALAVHLQPVRTEGQSPRNR